MLPRMFLEYYSPTQLSFPSLGTLSFYHFIRDFLSTVYQPLLFKNAGFLTYCPNKIPAVPRAQAGYYQ
jgi:hypothetical protein